MALIVCDISARDVSVNGTPLNCVCVNGTVVWRRDSSIYLRLPQTLVTIPGSGTVTAAVESNTQWEVEPIYRVEFSSEVVWLTEANNFTDDIDIRTTSLWDTNN